MDADAAWLKAWANLPAETPDALINRHLDAAKAALARRTGRGRAPAGLAAEWQEAHTVAALASLYPWLHTFALDGAARVGRLEGSVEARFLDAAEVDARVLSLQKRLAVLVRVLKKDAGKKTTVEASGLQMLAR